MGIIAKRAAGQGFEPRFDAPKAPVLPLDDPAINSVSPEGFEPPTTCLKGTCSAVELWAQKSGANENRTRI